MTEICRIEQISTYKHEPRKPHPNPVLAREAGEKTEHSAAILRASTRSEPTVNAGGAPGRLYGALIVSSASIFGETGLESP